MQSAAVRKAFAGSLKKEITEGSAQELGQTLQAVIQKEVDAIKAAATPLAKSLGNQKKLPTFNEAASALVKDKAASELLKKDVLLWNVVMDAHEKMKAPPQELMAERLAVASCGSADYGSFAMSVHILENLEKYFEWEASLPCNQPMKAQGDKMLAPFDKKVITEVVVRQVLNGALPPQVAASVASEAVGSSKDNLKDVAKKVRELLTSRAAEECKQAVLPRYAAPPEKKEGKAGKKEKGDADAGTGGKADTGGKKGGQAAAAGANGGAIAKYNGTMGEEFQWHILQYMMRPGTALSAASPAPGAKPAAGAKVGNQGTAAASGGVKKQKSSGGGSVSKPGGFGGTWATDLPPGHTPYSWKHEQQSAGRMPTPWDREGEKLPDGHTDYSWEAVQTGGSSSPSSQPSQPKGGKQKGGGAAPKAAPKQAAAAAATGGPPAGSPEEALCKLDLRVGKILSAEKAPDSEKLFLVKLDIGEDNPRQVITGLQMHYKAEQLNGRSVLAYCNIKPAKLAGLASEAMILAATKDKGADNEQCQLFFCPADSKAGTHVQCGSYEVGCLSSTVSVKNISKVWAQVQPDLKTDGKCQASFQGTALTLNGKAVTCESLSGVGIY